MFAIYIYPLTKAESNQFHYFHGHKYAFSAKRDRITFGSKMFLITLGSEPLSKWCLLSMSVHMSRLRALPIYRNVQMLNLFVQHCVAENRSLTSMNHSNFIELIELSSDGEIVRLCLAIDINAGHQLDSVKMRTWIRGFRLLVIFFLLLFLLQMFPISPTAFRVFDFYRFSLFIQHFLSPFRPYLIPQFFPISVVTSIWKVSHSPLQHQLVHVHYPLLNYQSKNCPRNFTIAPSDEAYS